MEGALKGAEAKGQGVRSRDGAGTWGRAVTGGGGGARERLGLDMKKGSEVAEGRTARDVGLDRTEGAGRRRTARPAAERVGIAVGVGPSPAQPPGASQGPFS